jgi:hypothetical protein
MSDFIFFQYAQLHQHRNSQKSFGLDFCITTLNPKNLSRVTEHERQHEFVKNQQLKSLQHDNAVTK